MADHWTIGDECVLCPTCGAELSSVGAKCPNSDCATNKKEEDK